MCGWTGRHMPVATINVLHTDITQRYTATAYSHNNKPPSFYFVVHVSICLFLIHLFSTIISRHQCHPHHSYHPSPHHSSFRTSKLFFFSNPTFHRHLALLRADFKDIRTALRGFFLRLSFFLVSVIVMSFLI